jgi:hypothetical protein
LNEEELFARVRRRTFGGVIEAIFSATAAAHGQQNWGYR